MTLPTSYKISSELFNVDPEPFAIGGFGDVYHGTLDGSKVSISRVRVYISDDPQKVTKVRYPRRHSSRLPSLTKLTELLPRGRNVEAADSLKHPPTSWYYHHSPPAHFESDAWWRSAGVHHGTPRCRPVSTRMSLLFFLPYTHPRPVIRCHQGPLLPPLLQRDPWGPQRSTWLF